MKQEDKEKIRQAFLEAAESPVAQNPLEGHGKTMRDVLLAAADSDAQYNALDKAIKAGKITVDGIIRQLRETYPPRLN